MKFKKLAVIGVLSIGLGYGGVYGYNANLSPNSIHASGKHDHFENLDEMERASDLIVIGKKVTTKDSVLLENGVGGYTGGWTISQFEFKKSLKTTQKII
jgi:hypothetical protein